MLDEIQTMHKSLLSVRTGSDSVSAQISPREELTSILLKYFNFDKNVLGPVLSGKRCLTRTINRFYI